MKATRCDQARRLEDLPNVGPSIAADLRRLGIERPEQLVGRDPVALYQQSCRLAGQRQDPCLLDVFLSAVRFMEGGPALPWWAFTALRKAPGPALTVAALWTWPVKSCRGVALASAHVGPRGLPFDREWMVVDAAGAFVTQRTHGALARVTPTFEADALRLEAPGAPALSLPLAVDPAAPTRRVRVWRWEGPALDAGDEAAAWFEALLGMPCRLVRRHSDLPRPAGGHAPGASVGFADAYPLLACTEESLAELNARLPHPVPMRAFRPNLVLAGGPAWGEDRWITLQAGSARLWSVKPCARCVIPTREPDTGEVRGLEPLRTLNALRPGPDGPLFGVNLAVERPGEVRVGDTVR